MAIEGLVARLKSSVQMGRSPLVVLSETIKLCRVEDTFALLQRVSGLSEFRDLALGVPLPGSLKDLGNWTPLVVRTLPPQSLFSWTAATIRAHATQIKRFLTYERQLEACTAVADWAGALDVLTDCETDLGISLWLLSNKFTVMERADGIDAQKQLLQKITAETNTHPIIRLIAALMSLCAEATLSADSFYDQISQGPFQKLPPDILEYITFHTAFFGPYQFNDLPSLLAAEAGSSIIDRYLTFIRIGQILYADQASAGLRKPFGAALRLLSVLNDDIRVSWLQAALNVSPQPLAQRFDRSIAEAFDAYTTGNYATALAQIDIARQHSKHFEEFIDLRASCFARLSVTGQAPTETPDSLTQALASVICSDQNFASATAAVKKQIAIFPHSRRAPILHAFLLRHAAGGKQVLNTRYERMADLAGSPSNPRALYFTGRQSTAVRQALYPLLPGSPTFALFAMQTQKSIPPRVAQSATAIPKQRLAKYLAFAALEKQDYPRTLEHLDTLESHGDAIDRLDAQELRCLTLLDSGDHIAGCRIAARAVLQHPFAQRRFPLGELWEIFENGTIDLSQQTLPIEVPNALGLYASYRRRGREYRIATVCEDFLASWGCNSPTELRKHSGTFAQDQLIFFLSEVCVIPVLDSHPLAYDSQSAVEDERVSILQWLIELEPSARAKYAAEIADITRRQKIRTAMHSVEKSKVAVNIPGVKSVLPDETKESFNRYLSLPYFTQAQVEDLIQQTRRARLEIGQSPVVLLLPPSERLEELRRFYERIRDKFVFSNDFGLDAHLSAGIRHVILPNQLRACFERVSLITEKSSSGAYAPNTHWRGDLEKLGIGDNGLTAVQRCLNTFSHSVDSLISLLRDELVRVNGEKYPNGLFEFSLPAHRVGDLDDELKQGRTYEQAVDSALSVLWEQTDMGLAAVRETMRTRIKTEILSSLDELTRDIRAITGGRANALESAITKAGTDIANQIEVVSNWFTRGDAAATEDYELGLAIDIAFAMVSRCYVSPELTLKKKCDASVKLKGYSLNGLVSILFWMFDNALNHGAADGGQVALELTIQTHKPQLIIIATNRMRPVEDHAALDASLEAIHSEIAAQATSEKVRGEGKSGLRKMARAGKIDLRAGVSLSARPAGNGMFSTTILLQNGSLWA